MKIALVQDWFVVNGGAEKVVREIVNLYDDIDIFSLVDFLSAENREQILKGKKSNTSFLQYFPLSEFGYRNYLPLFPTAIESLDFSGYDVIISSSYTVAKGITKTKDQLHICYCHSPVRYAWDLEEQYLAPLNFIKKFIARVTLKYIRKWDLKSNKSVDVFIANSHYVAERIKRIYNRDSVVLHPPVDTSSFTPCEEKEEYYFTSARMVPYKKIDLIIETFNALPNLKLVVSGDGPDLKRLQHLAKSNITFTGFLKKEELITKMQKAKAFVLAADEDFGITSLEAQSCCTPVIALKKGGYLETVVEGKTGVFFEEDSVNCLKNVILGFENINYAFSKDDFLNNVEKFSTQHFKKGFKKIVDEHIHAKSW